MNKKAEFKIQGMLIGLLFIGLFMGFVVTSINMLDGGYDTSGADYSDLTKYNNNVNLSADIESARELVETVTVDRNLFDFFAGIFNAILRPFKFIYESYHTMQSLVIYATSDLKIMSIVADFALTAVVILVIIGIVMIKFFLGRQK